MLLEQITHFNPVKLSIGSLDEPIRHLRGDNLLLVTTKGSVRRGHVDRIRKILGPRQLTVWDNVTSNPDLTDLDVAIADLVKFKFDSVIGLGGGSALDAAKAIAVTLNNPEAGTLSKVLRGGEGIAWTARLPLMAIPTTAGTGSEVTPFATLWDGELSKKYSLAGDFVYPDTAALDPSLTLTLGYNETLYPALDTISHALESIWNKNKTPFSEAMAIQSLIIANEALPIALSEPLSIDARRNMQTASALAGIAISQTRTAIAHSISYPLTAHFGVPHGLACSFTLPRLISLFLEHKPPPRTVDVIQDTAKLLKAYELDRLIDQYVSLDQIHSVKDEMYTPERADNLSFPLSQDTWMKLLN